MNRNRVYQPPQEEVLRSQINFAPYNPRYITEDAERELRKNLKTRGLLGGVVWNRTTGFLVSGHQRVAQMDVINHYDPENPETDYVFRCEVVEMDEKTEKEQNLFMNNIRVQGQFDDNLLREMFINGELDYSAAGFDSFDLQVLGIAGISEEDLASFDRKPEGDRPKWDLNTAIEDDEEAVGIAEETKESAEDTSVNRDNNFYEDSKENQIARHNEIQKIKDRINNKASDDNDGGMLSYIVVKFPSPASRGHFLQIMGYNDLYINQLDGEELLRKIEYGDEVNPEE